jgi:hypothetical protein
MTKKEAYALLPVDAKWSSSFGNPGEGGYVEYYRTPQGERWSVTNGALLSSQFDWRCEPVCFVPAAIKAKLARVEKTARTQANLTRHEHSTIDGERLTFEDYVILYRRGYLGQPYWYNLNA